MNGESRKVAVEYTPPGLRDLGTVLPGTTALHQAFMALAGEAVLERTVSGALLWGWSGTGKNLFPPSLQLALQDEGLPFGLLEIRCGKLPCLSSDELIDEFQQCRAIAMSEGVRPLIVAVDQVELLGDSEETFAS